jgi:plastin-1
MIKYFKDERSKTYHQINNHNLAIDGAKKIGAIIVNLGAEDLLEGKPYLVFGLLWQIIKIGLLKEVTTEKHPELLLLVEGDDVSRNLPPEELLLKWFNWQLERATGGSMNVHNLSKDIKDSAAYIHLMHRLDPDKCSLDALNEIDPLKRAEMMLQNAEKIGCRSFVTAQDVVEGNERLNLVFLANMFNNHIGSMTEEVQSENNNLIKENRALKAAVAALERQIEQVLCFTQSLLIFIKYIYSSFLRFVKSKRRSLRRSSEKRRKQ